MAAAKKIRIEDLAKPELNDLQKQAHQYIVPHTSGVLWTSPNPVSDISSSSSPPS